MSKYLKKLLKDVLPDDEISKVFSSFDIIGDIAIIKIPDSLLSKKNIIGHALLSNIPNLSSIFLQNTAVDGEYRLRGLELIAGVEKYITLYKEYGCKFLVNVASSYFSPRLSTERKRMADISNENETIVNMFAGVGTFSIIIAKKIPVMIYNIDSNIDAFILSKINSKLNKVEKRVVSIHGDAQNILSSTDFINIADRILMPLPEKAFEYVDVSINCLKSTGGYLHFFSHVKSDTKSAVIGDSEKYIHTLFSNYNY